MFVCDTSAKIFLGTKDHVDNDSLYLFLSNHINDNVRQYQLYLHSHLARGVKIWDMLMPEMQKATTKVSPFQADPFILEMLPGARG